MVQDLAQPWPSEIKLNAQKNKLNVKFLDGFSAEITAELLRVMSPSAEVQGHSPSQRKLISGKRTVLIQNIEPVGNYAIRIVFNDGHSTGIYTWAYLYDLGKRFDELLNTYVAELAAAGKTRDS